MIEKIEYFIYEFIATVGFVGYSPKAPGTAGSFVTLLLVYFLPTISFLHSIIVLSVIFFVGVFVSTKIAKYYNLHDPSIIVVDELLGMWIGLLALPKTWWFYLIAFILFRFFDITKIYPINKLEKIKDGYGIMLDDVLAGVFTFLLVHLMKTWLI